MATDARVKQRFQELRRELKREKAEKEEAMQALQETMSELEAFQGDGKTSPADLAKENKALKEQLRGDRYKKAWEEAAKDLKVKPDAIDDLRKLSDMKEDGDEPDPKAIRASIKESLKKRTWALDEAAEGEEGETTTETPANSPAAKELPLTKGDGADRGSRGKGPAGFMTVRRSDLGKPQWMRENQSKYVEAQRNGTLHMVD